MRETKTINGGETMEQGYITNSKKDNINNAFVAGNNLLVDIDEILHLNGYIVGP